MAAALKLARKTSLEMLIQEAGTLQAEISAKKAKYEYVRKEIADHMVIPEGAKETVATSEDYQAKLYLQEKTTVNPEKLYELAPDIFWRTCQVPVSAIQHVLPRDEFFVVTEVTLEPIPQLRISRVKNE